MRFGASSTDGRVEGTIGSARGAVAQGVPTDSHLDEPRFVQEPSAAGAALPVTVWLLDELECPAYTHFVEVHSAGTLFHSLAWRKVLTRAGLGRPCYLLAAEGERVVGVLPLFEAGQPGDTRLVSLPGTPTAGLLAEHEAARWLLASRATNLAERRHTAGVYMRVFEAQSASRPDGASPAWARVSVFALLAQARRAAKSPAASRLRTKPLEQAHLVHFQADQASLYEGLLALLSHGHALLCSYTQDDRQHAHAYAIWVVARQRTHVLTTCPAQVSSDAFTALLAHIGQHSAARGSRTIDFLLPAKIDDALAVLLARRETQLSREQPLPFPVQPARQSP
jgi:hypothetical protein